jgi:hypothetical protein
MDGGDIDVYLCLLPPSKEKLRVVVSFCRSSHTQHEIAALSVLDDVDLALIIATIFRRSEHHSRILDSS